MYLSAWDEEHFAILLEMLSFMSLGKEKNTKEMSAVGDSLAQEQENDESYIYRLSISYLRKYQFFSGERREIKRTDCLRNQLCPAGGGNHRPTARSF